MNSFNVSGKRPRQMAVTPGGSAAPSGEADAGTGTDVAAAGAEAGAGESPANVTGARDAAVVGTGGETGGASARERSNRRAPASKVQRQTTVSGRLRTPSYRHGGEGL